MNCRTIWHRENFAPGIFSHIKIKKHNISLHQNEQNLTFLDQTSLASPKNALSDGQCPWALAGPGVGGYII